MLCKKYQLCEDRWPDRGGCEKNDCFTQPTPDNLEEMIDLDKEDFDAMKQAASESTWIPPEYYQNDWVADVCQYLRFGFRIKKPDNLKEMVEAVELAMVRLAEADSLLQENKGYEANKKLEVVLAYLKQMEE